MNHSKILTSLGIASENSGLSVGTKWMTASGDINESHSPIDGKHIATIKNASAADYEMVVRKAEEAFKTWKTVPAPLRGEVVRQIGLALREKKEELGYIVSLEMGKIFQEGMGEV
ncbi:MAG TPA: aldehyde dehydrogenase family protein, partial [Williamwhitmania sp.]|nr:aldehyde dehydrogenase family protein [Williamwhitmania sp.]